MPGGMIFSRSWDFDQGNKPISLNDLRDDDDVLAVLLGLGLGISEADIAADLPDTGTPIGAALGSILDGLPPGTLPPINHGDQIGTLTIDADVNSRHEINLTGDLELTITGAEQVEAGVRVDGTGILTLVGATWDGPEVVLPGLIVLQRWATGWRAAAVQFDIPVVPAGVDFTEGTNTITKTNPSEEGVTYSIDGVALLFNGTDNTGFPEGLVNVVATADEGYAIVSGSQTEWPHTFGPLDADPLEPDELTNLLLHYDPSVPANRTMTGGSPDKVSALVNVGLHGAPATTHNLTQGTDANRPELVTVNGLDAVKFDADTDSLSKTGLTSPANTTDVTLFQTAVMDGTVATAVGNMFGNFATNAAGHVDVGRNIQVPGPTGTSPGQVLRASDIWSVPGTVLFMAVYIPVDPATQNTKLYIGIGTDLILYEGVATNVAALAHLFLGGNASRFTFCQGAMWDGEKTQADLEGIYVRQRAKWGAE